MESATAITTPRAGLSSAKNTIPANTLNDMYNTRQNTFGIYTATRQLFRIKNNMETLNKNSK